MNGPVLDKLATVTDPILVAKPSTWWCTPAHEVSGRLAGYDEGSV